MPISVDEAMGAYGYVYDIAQAIPSLNDTLKQAISEGWDQGKLVATVESSPWWKQNADTVRNLAIQAAAEPGTYQQNLANAKQRIMLKAQQLGRSYSDDQLSSMALNTLTTNSSWDDGVLSQLVTDSLPGLQQGDSGALEGNAAQLTTHMREVAGSYGVPVTDSFLSGATAMIQSGRDTIDGFEAIMRARAKAAFPQFAQQIDNGQTVRDIADPYISTMANTLEIPETSINLTDPSIQKAIAQNDPATGAQTSMPLWQFQRQLKDDPRYDQTTQARTDAFSVLHQVGKDFGFAT